jgi:arginine deiminase
MLSSDTVLMRPDAAYSLTARVLTPGAGGPRVSHPQAFLAAAAAGLDRLRVVETGFGPSATSREQWDDAGNLLVLAPGWWCRMSATWPRRPGWSGSVSR